MTYESTWFSKDKMMGKGDVLKAHSAIASITSWKTGAGKKKKRVDNKTRDPQRDFYVMLLWFERCHTQYQLQLLQSHRDSEAAQKLVQQLRPRPFTMIWFSLIPVSDFQECPSPDSLPEPSEINDCIRNGENISLADRKKNKWHSASL